MSVLVNSINCTPENGSHGKFCTVCIFATIKNDSSGSSSSERQGALEEARGPWASLCMFSPSDCLCPRTSDSYFVQLSSSFLHSLTEWITLMSPTRKVGGLCSRALSQGMTSVPVCFTVFFPRGLPITPRPQILAVSPECQCLGVSPCLPPPTCWGPWRHTD